MIVECRLLTNESNRFVPESYKDITLACELSGIDIAIVKIPSTIKRGHTSSGMELADIDQTNKLGMDGQNFYVNITSDCKIHYRDIIEFKDITLVITNINPLT